MEPQELDGNYWAPDSPDHRVFGTLQIDGGGVGRLDLKQMLRPKLDSLQRMKEDVVHGNLMSGEPLTLFGCELTGYKWTVRTAVSEYRANSILLGLEAAAADNISCSQIQLAFPALGRWLEGGGFVMAGPEHTDGPDRWTVSSEPASFPDGRVASLQAEIGLIESVSATGERSLHIGLEKRRSLLLRFDSPQGLERLAGVAGQVQRFLSLVTGWPVATEAIGLTVDDAALGLRRAPKAGIRLVAPMLSAPPSKDARGGEALLRPSDLGRGLCSALDALVAGEESIGYPVDVLMTSWYTEPLRPDVECLMLAQALETFHRTNFPGLLVASDVFRKACRSAAGAIRMSIAPELRKTLVPAFLEKGRWANEMSLRNRLRELLGSLSPVLCTSVTNDLEGLARLATDTRNYLTHRSENLRPKAANGRDLVILNRRLAMLLWLLLLSFLGVSPDTLASKVGKSAPAMRPKSAAATAR